ncbi:MAG: molybdopterin-dependent oxidoreductase, partial [Pseudomonadota bacterium]
RTDGAALPPGNPSAYRGSATVADIDDSAMILLIGTNPRTEAPVLNARIRKAWLAGAEVALIGEAADLTYDYFHAGDGPAALSEMLGHNISDETKAKKTLVILGQGALAREDGAAVLGAAMKMAEITQSGLLVLHTAASRVGAMDVGFAAEPGAAEDADVIYSLGVDEVDMPDGAFVIYQGSHGDRGAHRADVILPGAAYTEQFGLYVNTEGRPQMASRACFPPGDAKEDWAILRALSAQIGATQPWNDLDGLRAAMFEAHPHLARIDQIPPAEWTPVEAGEMGDAPFRSPIEDHYLTNPIARASEIMAELSRLAAARKATKLAAE